MPENANNPKAKRQKLPSAVGAMPDPSKVAVTKHYGQSVLEELDTPLGATQAPTVPVQQTGDKGKDVAEVTAGGTDQASASASSSKKPQSELASTSSRRSNFDSNPTGDEEAAVTVPALATASTIVVEPTDANESAIVVEASEISEQIILLSSADEKKQSLTNVNLDVKARLENREPKPFRDQPDQAEWPSGIGLCMVMILMQQPELTGEDEAEGEREGEAADHLQLNEPPMGVGGTVRLPAFEAGFANEGGDRLLMPSLEMKQVGIDGFLH